MSAPKVSNAYGVTTPVPPVESSEVAQRVRRQRPTPDILHEKLDERSRLKLRLQRRGPENLRRHMIRSARRFSVLLVADMASFWLMRAALRMVRDIGVFGTELARLVGDVLPRGLLTGTMFATALFGSLVIAGNYGRGDERRSPRRLFIACALATALPLWGRLWTNGIGSVVTEYVLTTVLVWIGLVVERLTLDRLVGAVYPPEQQAARALFVGPAEQCRAALRSPMFAASVAHRPIGFVDVGHVPAPDALGGIGAFARHLNDTAAEAVVVCGHLEDAQFDEVVETSLSAGCQLLTIPRHIQMPGVQPTIVPRGGTFLVELSAPSLKWWQFLVKRCFDLAASLAGLFVASPAMIAIAIAIRLDSQGPVFFRQDRIGRGGRRFGVWKFRTMLDGASDAAHRQLVTEMIAGDDAKTAAVVADGSKVYKLVRDPRITSVGQFLRRYSLDELPQVFNVIAGHMSLVGPRPPIAYEVEKYDHWQFGRLRALPGITGLWQVSGRNLLSYRQMCELDMQYVRNWSLALDLRILMKTVPVVLFNSGRAH